MSGSLSRWIIDDKKNKKEIIINLIIIITTKIRKENTQNEDKLKMKKIKNQTTNKHSNLHFMMFIFYWFFRCLAFECRIAEFLKKSINSENYKTWPIKLKRCMKYLKFLLSYMDVISGNHDFFEIFF